METEGPEEPKSIKKSFTNILKKVFLPHTEYTPISSKEPKQPPKKNYVRVGHHPDPTIADMEIAEHYDPNIHTIEIEDDVTHGRSWIIREKQTPPEE